MNYKMDLKSAKITWHDHDFAREMGVPLIVAKLLLKHHITTKQGVHNFLHPSLKQLDDPFKLHDMHKAVKLIKTAISNHDKIFVYSDYDVDGISSNTIMLSVLKRLGANVTGYCPDRAYDNYGINMHESKRIAKEGYKLVITTDNGISCLDEVKYLKQHHIKVIIADHHDFPPKMPPADAIVMTLYPGHHYPNETDFCGTGIAFKIAQALLGRVPTEYLDLACLATVADSVNATKENRVFLKYGLQEIKDEPRIGLVALAKVSRMHLSKLTAPELGFTINPRLNALGRMGKLNNAPDVKNAIKQLPNQTPAEKQAIKFLSKVTENANLGRDLLLTKNPIVAQVLADVTEHLNRERQKIMHNDTRLAMKIASTPENKKRNTLVIIDPHIFPGTSGIVASQLQDKYYKPVICGGHLPGDPKTKDRASGRSISEFNLFTAMNPLRKDMISFGGHPMACGLSIKTNKINNLSRDLENNSKKLGHVVPTIHPDCLLPIKNISRYTYNDLQCLQPFGVGNEQPLFCVRLPRLYNLQQMGNHNIHLKFTVKPSFRSPNCVAWHMGDLYQKFAQNPYDIELVGYLQINHYHHMKLIQINVKYIHHYYKKSAVKHNLRNIYGLLFNLSNHKHKKLALDKSIYTIADTLKFMPEIVKHSLIIFKELHFINIQGNQLSLAKHPKHQALTNAPSYSKYFPE